MSKVFSFRLDADNPREARAREVINTWLDKGYSLRYLVTDALISYMKEDIEKKEFGSVVDQLQELILSLDKIPEEHPSNTVLPNTFINAIKKSAHEGIRDK